MGRRCGHGVPRCGRGGHLLRTEDDLLELGLQALELLRSGLFATDRTDQVLTLSSAKPFDWTVEQSIATAHFVLEKAS